MKYIVEQDGDMWFAHYEDFSNLQESSAEFGDTPISALKNLIKSENNMKTFSEALVAVKAGKSIQREGWNGKGLLVKAQFPDEHSKTTLPYLYIEYPDGKRCPWLASQTDLMCEDWVIL